MRFATFDIILNTCEKKAGYKFLERITLANQNRVEQYYCNKVNILPLIVNRRGPFIVKRETGKKNKLVFRYAKEYFLINLD